LETEIRKLKENFQMVLDKSGTDDELLEMLRGEIGRLKAQSKINSTTTSVTLSKEDQRYSSGASESRDVLLNEVTRLQRLCKNQVHI
jgi:hypothetical protein